MRSSALRTVLLVKAIEEADPDGMVLPLAERELATREAKLPPAAKGRAGKDEASDAAGLPARGQRFLARRARALSDRLALRYPALHAVEAAARGTAWLAPLGLVLSLAAGIGLSQLDGSKRINILAYPLLGIVAWNFVVYGVLAVGWFRRVVLRRTGSQGGLGRALARLAFAWSRRFGGSAGTPETLGHAVRNFAEVWWRAAGNLLTVQAKRLLHLCAAALALGLVGGFYARGIALQYVAGWESTFLDASAVHSLLAIFLGPAAAVTGQALALTEHLAAIRWVDNQGGENAAAWVHLFAAAAVLYVVLPRLLLAAAATLTLWRLRLRSALPPALLAYYHQLAGGGETLGLASARIFPYSFAPTAEVKQHLERWLARAFGSALATSFAPHIPYGEEEGAAREFRGHGGPADLLVLLFSLAATPEEENHGVLIEAAREAQSLLIVVDESAFQARFGTDPGYALRLEERRTAWRVLGEGRGIRIVFFHAAPDADQRQQAAAARELSEALWSRQR